MDAEIIEATDRGLSRHVGASIGRTLRRPPVSSCLRLEEIHRTSHQLAAFFTIGDLRFSTTHWYEDVDLLNLEERYGAEYMEKVYFHIAAFDLNSLTTLGPDAIDLGKYARWHTPAFDRLWHAVLRGAFAQWRYEHDRPYDVGPRFTTIPAPDPVGPVRTRPGAAEVLLLAGGGKDSLVSQSLLERGGITYATFSYSHSVYGTSATQHDLIRRLVDHGHPRAHHRAWIYDDYLDSPVARIHPDLDIQHVAAAETPASVFASVPLLLEHGYQYLAVGHERSANTGNLVWEETGEEINHQWGKSREAQLLLDRYLREELVDNAGYFSLLEPLHDVAIFNLLHQDLDALRDAHSCNVKKPWCQQCAKCAYVWLNYLAYLPRENVQALFPNNLFDDDANLLWFRQMLGLEAHTPFECIGEVGEAQLAFELCRRQGYTGRAMDMYSTQVPHVDTTALAEHYLTLDTHETLIPAHLLPRLVPLMQAGAEAGRQHINATIPADAAA